MRLKIMLVNIYFFLNSSDNCLIIINGEYYLSLNNKKINLKKPNLSLLGFTMRTRSVTYSLVGFRSVNECET